VFVRDIVLSPVFELVLLESKGQSLPEAIEQYAGGANKGLNSPTLAAEALGVGMGSAPNPAGAAPAS